LLDNLGVPRKEFDGYDEGYGIQFALNLAFNIAQCGDRGRALGYMLVNEAMTPVTYEAARGGLGAHYPTLLTNFFDLHIEVDEHHVQALYEAVELLPESEEASVL
jgi:pyrroloquinoline quinone (PQQ) biosynthesis protein C